MIPIKCSERMPPAGEAVLVFVRSTGRRLPKHWAVAYLDDEPDWLPAGSGEASAWRGVDPGRWPSEIIDEWDQETPYWFRKEVSHWCELPKDPK
jgi:hypothetical protein